MDPAVVIILTVLGVGTVFTILFFRRRHKLQIRREQRFLTEQRKEELKTMMENSDKARYALFDFLKTNEAVFYSLDTIQKLEECKNSRIQIENLNKAIEAELGEEQIRQKVEEMIEEAKKEAGCYLDPFGMEEEIGRMLGNASLQLTAMKQKLVMNQLMRNWICVYFHYRLGSIFPESKTNKDFIEKCLVFLKQELETFRVARSFNLDTEVGSRKVLMEAIFPNIDQEELSVLKAEFQPFLQVA